MKDTLLTVARSVIGGATMAAGAILIIAAFTAGFDMSESSMSEAGARILTGAIGLCCLISAWRT